MAMNKLEKALLETALRERDLAQALRWPVGAPPKLYSHKELIDAGSTVEITSPYQKKTCSVGFIFVDWRIYESGVLEILQVAQDGYCQSYANTDGEFVSWSQRRDPRYLTKQDAARAALFHVARQSAERLLTVEQAIKEMEP